MRIAALLYLTITAALYAEENAHPEVTDRDRAAEAYLQGIEDDLAKYRLLPPAERMRKEAQLESSLERALDKSEKTRLENKALYLLASWRFQYKDAEGVEELITRLNSTGYPAYKNFARYLQIQVDLKRGRLATARERASKLAQEVPEFAAAGTLVAFYERIGKKPDKTSGRNLIGGPDDPANAYKEPWLVYVFVDSLEGEDAMPMQRFCAELGKEKYRGKARLICVTYAINPLPVTARFQREFAFDGADLLWASPNAEGDATAWTKAWGVPGVPAVALLGPDRSIMAVQCTPEELRPLVGAEKDKKENRAPADDEQPRRRGKNF